MILTNANDIRGIYPHKGKKHYKRVNVFGEVAWLPCDQYKLARYYNDSYLTVPPSVVHPDNLKLTERTSSGDAVYLRKGMRLIAPYKVAVHDGPDSSAYTMTPPKNGMITIERISYGNAYVAHTVWYTDGTEGQK